MEKFSLYNLNLNTRTFNALANNLGWWISKPNSYRRTFDESKCTLEAVEQLTLKQLLRIKNFGEKSIEHLCVKYLAYCIKTKRMPYNAVFLRERNIFLSQTEEYADDVNILKAEIIMLKSKIRQIGILTDGY